MITLPASTSSSCVKICSSTSTRTGYFDLPFCNQGI